MFNVMGFMITELGLKTGRYPEELDDMQDHSDMFEAYLALKEEINDKDRNESDEGRE
jgi:hypothetical protein